MSVKYIYIYIYISHFESTWVASFRLHGLLCTIIAVSSHSFMSIGNLFSTKSPKKIIETSFGLSGIRIIQEESISVFQFLPKKVTKASSNFKGQIP